MERSHINLDSALRESGALRASQIAPSPAQCEAIRTTLKACQRTLKAACLYPPTNPLIAQALGAFYAEVSRLQESLGTICLVAGKESFSCGGEIISPDKSDDPSLSRLLFDNGISFITISPTFTATSAEAFVDVMRQVAQRDTGGVELGTLLWAAEIPGLDFDTVEDVSLENYSDILNSFRQNSLAQLGLQVAPADKHQFEQSISVEDETDLSNLLLENFVSLSEDTAPQQVCRVVPSYSQMSSHGYSLDADEQASVEGLRNSGAAFDERADLLALLEDIVSQEGELTDFVESFTAADRVQSEYLRRGEFCVARRILELLRARLQEIETTRPLWSQRLTETLASAAGHDRMKLITNTLNADNSLDPRELIEYLAMFDWTAYAAVAGMLGVLESREHRLAVCDYLGQMAKEHVDLVANGLYDKRWFVARNTAMILARISGSRAQKHLEKAFTHEDPRVRVEIVANLNTTATEFTSRLLALALLDDDSTIRSTARTALSSLAIPAQEDIYVAAISTQRFGHHGEDIRSTMLAGYAAIGGEAALVMLTSMATKGSLLGSPTSSQLLACRTLAECRTSSAEQTLRRLAASWRFSTRVSARAALKGIQSAGSVRMSGERSAT